jgi:diaminohydroxyphosphoribosylaminopyrimidine deaminase/5-amino-6-(5-phosphoribosylamino)uracil reductase
VARQPLRVVCDTQLELPARLTLFRSLAKGTVVACAKSAPRARQVALERRGAKVWRLEAGRGGVSPKALARLLVRADCHEVLLEGGAELGTAWFRSGLVDRIALFVAPRVLGAEGLAWCGPLGISRLERARTGLLVAQRRHGEDALLMVEFGT